MRQHRGGEGQTEAGAPLRRMPLYSDIAPAVVYLLGGPACCGACKCSIQHHYG